MEKQFAVKGMPPPSEDLPIQHPSQFCESGTFWFLTDLDSHYTAVQHMTTYWAILEKMRGSTLRLTKMDDEILSHFKETFPDFDPAATIDEDAMKSKAGKEKWRNFMNTYEILERC